MANLKQVNDHIKANFPRLDIEAVSGDGHVYFNGFDGFNKVDSIYVNAPSIDTPTLVDMCIGAIYEYLERW